MGKKKKARKAQKEIQERIKKTKNQRRSINTMVRSVAIDNHLGFNEAWMGLYQKFEQSVGRVINWPQDHWNYYESIAHCPNFKEMCKEAGVLPPLDQVQDQDLMDDLYDCCVNWSEIYI